MRSTPPASAGRSTPPALAGHSTPPALAGHSTLCGRPVAGDRALIMAIVNRTPDSFYDKGATFSDAAARDAVHRAVADGADVIDVGGVKAGPGERVDVDTEITRLVPFIEWLRGAYPDQLISVDTWRAQVAKAACAAGADLINDTWGGVDPAMPEVAAEFGAGLVCAHTGGALPRTRPFRVSYGTTTRGVVDAVISQVTAAAERAVAAGVAPREGVDRPGTRLRQEHLPWAAAIATRGRSCYDRVARADGFEQQGRCRGDSGRGFDRTA
ncbi:dihydropteroate synthase 2 folP2 [Mycobacterium tuberculosis KZN 1435]|nr:dihydropteroate synthase 2 folP2 [Mycobacterium tuberculosis KZN 1435]